MGYDFDDAKVEDNENLKNPWLLELAGTGARIRSESREALNDIATLDIQPRGIVACGLESRLIRTMIEPVCPIPFVSWAGSGLPGWVGSLDLVIILAAKGDDFNALSVAIEAKRRGASLLVSCPSDSVLAEEAKSNSTIFLSTATGDPLAASIAILAVLGRWNLGPLVIPEHVAEAADVVAESCSPRLDLSHNFAKELAIGLADRTPFLWGGTVLAARASRRIAEELRASSLIPALAARADHLVSLLLNTQKVDPFLDPIEDESCCRQPTLVLCKDGDENLTVSKQLEELEFLALSNGVHVYQITCGDSDIPSGKADRYMTLLLNGLYAAAYLAIGLGRDRNYD